MSMFRNVLLVLSVYCCSLNIVGTWCESIGDVAATIRQPAINGAILNSTWIARRKEDAKKSARAFENGNQDNVFDYEFKATPVFNQNAQVSSVGNEPQPFQTSGRPASQAGTSGNLVSGSSYFPASNVASYQTPHVPSQSYSAPSHSYGAPSQIYGAPAGYHYPSQQYLPPQHIENFETGPFTNQSLEVNTNSLLFVQPGKCSNSIEVGRVRDVEVKTGIKYGAETQKGNCVIMLYAANELNKLAVSLQPVQGTTNVIPTGTWLQTNVKMFATQAGDIQPIFINANFGPGSPALILTRSNIVLLSFVIDRSVDFFVDVSTYQSATC